MFTSRPRLSLLLISGAAATMLGAAIGRPAPDLDMTFADGVDAWRVVVDGVMGGLSTGRVTQPAPGVLRFTGEISLDNNGGFSQTRRTANGRDFAGATGVELDVRGDGRTYIFDLRTSDARLMAGGFQQEFTAKPGGWSTVRLPFDGFQLTNFGEPISGPTLVPSRIESIGVTLADKQEGRFELDLSGIRTYGEDDGPSPGSSRSDDLATVARGAGLSTLLDLVSASGVALPPHERLTIFAPTNEAFAALPKDTVEFLLSTEGRATLQTILSHHVCTGDLTSSDLLGRRSIATLSGQRVDITAEGMFTVDDARVLATDVAFDNGTVHVIDSVLMPELATIAAIAVQTEELATLTAAVDAAGLAGQLGEGNGPYTVFAPVNSAFERLPEGVLDTLLESRNRSRLAAVLGLHVVPGRINSSDFLAIGAVETYFGDIVDIRLSEGSVRIGNAAIVKTDIDARNGVIHLIDDVILPTAVRSDSLASADESAAMRDRVAGLLDLAVNRGAPLFNDGQQAACAAIYELSIASVIILAADDLPTSVIDRLERGLAEGQREHDAGERAWTYRRAIDDAYTRLVGESD